MPYCWRGKSKCPQYPKGSKQNDAIQISHCDPYCNWRNAPVNLQVLNVQQGEMLKPARHQVQSYPANTPTHQQTSIVNVQILCNWFHVRLVSLTKFTMISDVRSVFSCNWKWVFEWVSVIVGQIRTPRNLQNCSYVFSCCFLPFPTKPCEKKKLSFSVKTKTAPGFEVLAILFRVHRQVLDLYLHVQTANDGHKIGNIQTRVAHLLHEFLHALHPFVLVPGRNLRIKTLKIETSKM